MCMCICVEVHRWLVISRRVQCMSVSVIISVCMHVRYMWVHSKYLYVSEWVSECQYSGCDAVKLTRNILMHSWHLQTTHIYSYSHSLYVPLVGSVISSINGTAISEPAVNTRSPTGQSERRVMSARLVKNPTEASAGIFSRKRSRLRWRGKPMPDKQTISQSYIYTVIHNHAHNHTHNHTEILSVSQSIDHSHRRSRQSAKIK